jgi:hypothetical protein
MRIEFRDRYEFHLAGDRSRDARLEVSLGARRYQLMHIVTAVNEAGKTVWHSQPEAMPYIVQRWEMIRIERLRTENVKRYGHDPLFSILEELDERAQKDPFAVLREQFRRTETA